MNTYTKIKKYILVNIVDIVRRYLVDVKIRKIGNRLYIDIYLCKILIGGTMYDLKPHETIT